jgi:hypothetical protein
MSSYKFSNNKFLKLLEASDLNIVKKAEEFEKLDHKVSSSWLKNGMSEEELQEASLKYLSLASKIQKVQKEANLLLKSRASNLTGLQMNILKLIADWSNALKQSYKSYSDYLAYGKIDDEHISAGLKEEAITKKAEFKELLISLKGRM